MRYFIALFLTPLMLLNTSSAQDESLSERLENAVKEEDKLSQELKNPQYRVFGTKKNEAPQTFFYEDENIREIQVGPDPDCGIYPHDESGLKLQGVEGESLQDLYFGDKAWQNYK